mmetsp:Transcript_24211/g.58473  ORF Transcript_24211/g.58473 Transcript_24211/m.58473 type:complete len:97 (+) Transcript_24211:164-454(+)
MHLHEPRMVELRVLLRQTRSPVSHGNCEQRSFGEGFQCQEDHNTNCHYSGFSSLANEQKSQQYMSTKGTSSQSRTRLFSYNNDYLHREILVLSAIN